MKHLHPTVIHHLTTAYYNSLYLTSVFVQLYITGLFVVSDSMPCDGSHRRSRPVYIQSCWIWHFSGWRWCCSWDVNGGTFAMAAFVITYGWVTVFTCISGLHFIIHLDLNCEIWQPTFHESLCSRETGAQRMRPRFSSVPTKSKIKG